MFRSCLNLKLLGLLSVLMFPSSCWRTSNNICSNVNCSEVAGEMLGGVGDTSAGSDEPACLPVKTAFCYRHGMSCLLCPPLPPSQTRCRSQSSMGRGGGWAEALGAEARLRRRRGCVAGINCYDWSTMGGTQGWLGESTIVFLQFVRECLEADYDWIILECTQGFDLQGLRCLEAKYMCVCLHITPQQLGFPANRLRKYMLLTHQARLAWLPCIEEIGNEAAFLKLFHRRVMLYGDELLRAPLVAQNIFAEQMIQQRGLPAKRRSGRPWRAYQLLGPAMRVSVVKHEPRANRLMGRGCCSEVVQPSADTQVPASHKPCANHVAKNFVVVDVSSAAGSTSGTF